MSALIRRKRRVVFTLMSKASSTRAVAAPVEAADRGCPSGLDWRYDGAELFADGLVHGLGVALGITGAVALVVHAADTLEGHAYAAVLVYAVGLLAMLGLSAAYNLWPVSACKWWLRRFDHAAIYVLIAATYTPFLAQIGTTDAAIVLCAIWAVALAGIALKLTCPGRFDRCSMVLYLALGWSGALVLQPALAALPRETLLLLAGGGALFTIGVVFHLWRRLRFQNAIWHAAVLGGVALHYEAVFDLVLQG
jgi:hemolysin III